MSKDRKAVTTYLTHFNNHITENKVYARLHELMTNSNPNHTLAEQIDRELIQAGKHAENACRRRKTNYLYQIEIEEQFVEEMEDHHFMPDFITFHIFD